MKVGHGKFVTAGKKTRGTECSVELKEKQPELKGKETEKQKNEYDITQYLHKGYIRLPEHITYGNTWLLCYLV